MKFLKEQWSVGVVIILILLVCIAVNHSQVHADDTILKAERNKILKEQNEVLEKQLNEMIYANCLERLKHNIFRKRLFTRVKSCDLEYEKMRGGKSEEE